jgi:hypothetical protein
MKALMKCTIVMMKVVIIGIIDVMFEVDMQCFIASCSVSLHPVHLNCILCSHIIHVNNNTIKIRVLFYHLPYYERLLTQIIGISWLATLLELSSFIRTLLEFT